jgi:hypothetical protein
VNHQHPPNVRFGRDFTVQANFVYLEVSLKSSRVLYQFEANGSTVFNLLAGLNACAIWDERDRIFEVGDDFFGDKADPAVGETDGDGGAAGDFAVDHDAGGWIGFDDDAVGQETGGGGPPSRRQVA